MKNFTAFLFIWLSCFVCLQAQDIIVDGTFDDSTGVWETEQYNGAAFEFDIENGVAQIIMDTQGANFYDPQLKQIVTIETGWQYDISFDIYASTDSVAIQVWLQENHADWATLSSVTVTASNEWQTYSFITDEIENDDDNAKITFVFGNVTPGDTILIDNVSMSYSDGTSALEDREFIHPLTFSLSQNYPNPFNPITAINYNIPFTTPVMLKIFNLEGQQIATLVDEIQNPGEYSVNFYGSGLSSGIYFYKIDAGEFSLTKKMMLIK